MKQIITHTDPDLDAVVSAWLAQDFLFSGEASEVLFVSRKIPAKFRESADCWVDIGNAYNPQNHIFDHKPPAFENRNSTCATRLLWEYLREQGRDVAHLEPLVQVTYEGDTHRNTAAVKQSRKDGPHAELSRLKAEFKKAPMVYEKMVVWLRANYQTI